MIENIDKIKVDELKKIEVAKYLYALKEKHIHVDCIIYNAKYRKILWNRGALKKYMKKGDAAIRSIAEKILL